MTMPPRRLRATEAQEQEALIQWADTLTPQEPRLALLFHVPNGGKRSKGVAGQMRAQGVRAGVPDLWLPVASAGFHGLVIEMKAQGGAVSKEQRWWIDRLFAQGYATIVAWEWTDAAEQICRYLDRLDLPLPEVTR
jgi:VRR-NUC domain